MPHGGEPLGPPYLRVVAAYTGVTWPAMAGIAVLAEPIINLLYGARWIGAAQLLGWVALSQLCYVALPLKGDLPVLLGRRRGEGPGRGALHEYEALRESTGGCGITLADRLAPLSE